MAKYFDVTGIEEIMSKLQRMDEATRKKHLVSAAKQAGKNIIEHAQQNVPEATGNLKESIGAETMKGQGPRTGMVGVGPRRKKGKKGWQGWHAYLVEFGTSGARRVKDKKVLSGGGKFFGKEVAPMPKNPFMRTAWDSKGQETNKEFQEILAKKLKDAIK